MLLTLAVVALTVSLVVLYVGSYARIAQYAFHRQALRQEYAQLTRDCLLLKMATDPLAAQPRLTEVAMAQGFTVPDLPHFHYVRIANNPQWMATARQTPGAAAAPNWFASSLQQCTTALGHAVAGLGRGPGIPAYAR